MPSLLHNPSQSTQCIRQRRTLSSILPLKFIDPCIHRPHLLLETIRNPPRHHHELLSPIRRVRCQAASGSIGGDGSYAPKPGSQSSGSPSLGAVLSKLVSEQFLPLALISMMVLGALQPAWGMAAAKTPLQKYVTMGIFVISGLQLRRGEAIAALKSLGVSGLHAGHHAAMPVTCSTGLQIARPPPPLEIIHHQRAALHCFTVQSSRR